MNCYATLTVLKRRLGITATTHDAVLLEVLEAASRQVDDDFCQRHFYCWEGSRYYNGTDDEELLIEDLLSLSALNVDSDADGSWDDDVWTATDWMLLPLNEFPKLRLRAALEGDYALPAATLLNGIQMTGVWGYGDGESATPYEATAVTATVADATGTTLTLSAEGTVQAGHTIRVDSEQMFVSAVTSDASKQATVERGVNGTTAASHSAKAVSIYQYPVGIREATLQLAIRGFLDRDRPGVATERVALDALNYSYTRSDQFMEGLARALMPYRRIAV